MKKKTNAHNSDSSSVLKSQKDVLKEEGDRLNKRAIQLNDLVHQIRRTQVRTRGSAGGIKQKGVMTIFGSALQTSRICRSY